MNKIHKLLPGFLLSTGLVFSLTFAASNIARADHVRASSEVIVHHDQSRRSEPRYPTRQSRTRQSRTRQTPARQVNASYPGPYLSPYLAVGLGSGGDVIGSFRDDFGDVDRVRSGGGFLLEAGALALVDPYTSLRVTAGYEGDSATRSNGDSTFERFRFDLMLLRSFGASEFGVGLTTHTGVGFSCEISAICSGNIDFDTAIGFTLEYALTANNYFGNRRSSNYRGVMRGARLGLRFTGIEYEPEFAEGIDATIVDGSSLTAFVGVSF